MSVQTILVGVDGSAGSRAALTWATDLAADLRAKLVLLHVFEPLAHLAELAPGADLRAARGRATASVRGPMCEDLRARGLEYETLVREGEPAQVIVEAADEVGADLIVVGARAMGAVKGLLLGSTSSRLARLTPRPVVIVHAPELP